MMFILRTIFWLGVIILLLPAGNSGGESTDIRGSDAQGLTTGKALDAAHAAVDDLSSFCRRNPEACEVGAAALAAAEETAKYGVRAIYDWATSPSGGIADSGDEATPRPESNQKAGRLWDDVDITGSIAVAAGNSRKSGNTLRIEDVIPEWGGPRTRKRA